MGNHVKEGIPWSTFTGLCALELAAAGFTGPIDILDHPDKADEDGIFATPTLVRVEPKPVKKIMGDLSDRRMVLEKLELIKGKSSEKNAKEY